MSSYELARRLSGTGVTANVLHPGLVRTGFASNLGAFQSAAIDLFMRFVGLTPEQGAQTSVYLATSAEVENVTGKYWEKCKAVPSGRAAYDKATWRRLWEASDKMVLRWVQRERQQDRLTPDRNQLARLEVSA